MMTSRIKHSLGALALIAMFSVSVFPAARELSQRQKEDMVSCALHGGGGWLESDLYSDGKIRFSYSLEPSESKDSSDLYVAFWNTHQSAGELLVFNLSKNSDQRDFFIINNQGHIRDINGQLDIRDALWGVYTYRKIKALLPRLQKQTPTIFGVDQLPTSESVCKTPVDFKGGHN
jgi:hypothetical protein